MFITKIVLYFYCHYMFGIVKLCLIYVGQWDSMEEYMCLIPRNSYNGAFYRAVFALHTENYQQAQQVQYLYTVHLYTTGIPHAIWNTVYSVKMNTACTHSLLRAMGFIFLSQIILKSSVHLTHMYMYR